MLVATWLHSETKKGRNSFKNRSPEALKNHRFFVRFLFDFGSILGGQIEAKLPSFSAQNGVRCEVQASFLSRWLFSLIFTPPVADGIPHFLASGADGVPHFGSFLGPKLALS